MSITKNFPRAEEIKELKPQDLDLWMIERQLKEIKRCIFEAVHKGRDCITRIHMEQGTIDFLRDHGYLVVEDEGFYVIYWNRLEKKEYQTGGVVSYNILENNKYRDCCTNGIIGKDYLNWFGNKIKNKN